MSKNAKKVSAAIAAVNAYLEEEQATAAREARKPVALPSPWASSGRERIMSMRTLVAARLWK